MIPSFLMFLAPGNPTQATPTSPQRESRFPAPGYAGRRLHSTAQNGRSTPLVPFTRYGTPRALLRLRRNRTLCVACATLDLPNQD